MNSDTTDTLIGCFMIGLLIGFIIGIIPNYGFDHAFRYREGYQDGLAAPKVLNVKLVSITGEFNASDELSGYEVSQLNKTFVQVEFYGILSLVSLDNNHTLLLNTDRGLFRSDGAVEVTGYQLIFHVPALEGYYFEPVTFGS